MKKIFYILLFSGILGLTFSLFGMSTCLASPGLSGTIEASDTSVAPDEEYNITVRGESDVEVGRLFVFIYLEGNPSPIASWFCDNSSTCTLTRSYSQRAEGDYTYYGRVTAAGERSFRTDSVTIEVTPAPAPGPGPGPGPGPSPDGGFSIEIQNPLKAGSFKELVDAIINFIFWMGITIAPIMFIIAGFLFVTSMGDPERVKTARKMMLYTAIGLVIVLAAKGLILVLKEILGVTS